MPNAKSSIKLGKAFAALAFASLLAGCGNAKPNDSLSPSSKESIPSLIGASISEDGKFHTANLPEVSQDAFESLGFALGDSCDVSFSNGAKYEDVPYYNGYYVKNGEPVIVAYPSSACILVTLNNVGIWEQAKLETTYTVDITLNEKGKYLATQEALGQSYSLERGQYGSDEEFSNFRSLKGGSLKESFIYRGASPFDNSRNRAPITDSLLQKNGIKTIVDLADGEGDMNAYIGDSAYSFPYSEQLYHSEQAILLGMGSSYGSDAYKQSLAEGIRFMLKKDSPFYIHCMEGKDRTGFVCTLIEALAGASYAEMRDDYMKTYANYYKISQEKTPEKYEAVVSLYFDSFCEFLHSESDVSELKEASYVEDAKLYLREGGLSDSEIASFVSLISK